jgi:cobalamin biosynthesis protein CbiG
MGVAQAMIVAGVGCRRGAASEDVLATIAEALAAAGRTGTSPARLATNAAKSAEPGLRAAAVALGATLAVPLEAALQAAAPHCLTHSGASLAATGLPSLAEAAALAAAGPGARLLGPRLTARGVTCALAEAQP